MPEGPELRLMADFLNQHKNQKIQRTDKSAVTKIKTEDISSPAVFMGAESRGKELMLLFAVEADTASGFYPLKYFFTMGMSGNWQISNSQENYPKHSHFHIRFTDTIISMIDPRRFAKWKIDNDWNIKRSPDPILQAKDWWVHFNHNIGKKKYDTVPIYELLMDQFLFNGVGNYIRAEVLYRMDINPQLTHWDIEIPALHKAICAVMHEAYQVGGMEMYAFKNPNDLDITKNKGEWQQCYNKPHMSCIVDSNGRNFWFDPKWKLS